MTGKRKDTFFDESKLKEYGCAPGSAVIMTPSAFMTDAAWLEFTPSLIKGIRSMPYIVDHPDWWVRMTLDGFGSHVNKVESLRMFYDAKIEVIFKLKFLVIMQ